MAQNTMIERNVKYPKKNLPSKHIKCRTLLEKMLPTGVNLIADFSIDERRKDLAWVEHGLDCYELKGSQSIFAETF